jgi:hypothetical protein
MVAMLVKKHSVDYLVGRIQKGRVITKDKVLNESESSSRALRGPWLTTI